MLPAQPHGFILSISTQLFIADSFCWLAAADANVADLSREQRLQLLGRLRRKLQSLALSLAAAAAPAAGSVQPTL